jgi:hypothetical protein
MALSLDINKNPGILKLYIANAILSLRDEEDREVEPLE